MAEDVIDAALESFKAEYDSVDVYESPDSICMLPTVAKDIDFYELEMVNRASMLRLRSKVRQSWQPASTIARGGDA